MHVKTNLTRADIIRLNLHVMLKTKLTIYMVGWTCFLIFLCWFANPPNEEFNILVIILTSVLLVVGFMMFGIITSILFAVLVSTEKSGVLGEHHFVVLPEGLQEETKANKTLIKWNGIQKPIKTKKFILVPINIYYLYHIIPRRSFDDQASYDKFWTEIFTYHTAAKKNPQG